MSKPKQAIKPNSKNVRLMPGALIQSCETFVMKVSSGEEVGELRNRLLNITVQLHETTDALVHALRRIQELEDENIHLRKDR